MPNVGAQVEPLLWGLLGQVVFPAWLIAGFADYLFHSRTDLARTSGVHESALHLLQTAEIGLPLLAFLFFAVDAATLALMVAGVLAHTITSYRDLRYTELRRRISPAEQYAHSFLNVLPWVALALVTVLHWPVVQALLDPGLPCDWQLHLRRPPFPAATIGLVLSASLLLGVIPGAMEFAHALATRRRTRSGPGQ